MPKIIAFVGGSNSGKTTLIQKIVPVLKKRGYSLCVIKHIHGDLQLDKKGKDTDKFRRAGADMVMMQNKNTLAMVKKIKKEEKIEEIIKKHGHEYDLVIVEGFKKSNLSQIWVYSDNTDVKIDRKKIIAVAGKKVAGLSVTVFGKRDFKAIADFIEKNIIQK